MIQLDVIRRAVQYTLFNNLNGFDVASATGYIMSLSGGDCRLFLLVTSFTAPAQVIGGRT